LGYVAKEAALESMLHTEDGFGTAALVLIVLGSILTFAYGMRFMWGAFASKPGVELSSAQRTSRLIVTPAAVLAVAGVVVGFLPGGVERVLAPHADSYPGEPGHLTLWGGFGPALYLTLLVVAVGVVLFLWRAPVERFQGALWEFAGAAGVYRRDPPGTARLAAGGAAVTPRGSPPGHPSANPTA